MFKSVAILCLLYVSTSKLVGAEVDESIPEDDSYMHKRPVTMGRFVSSVRAAEDYNHWQKDGQDTLRAKLGNEKIERQAKHIIFFLGDGMSVPTVTAARIYKGQSSGQPNNGGEEAILAMEGLPNIGVSKTFCTDAQTADSACSATAYLGGAKANIGTIGVKETVQENDCVRMMKPENHVLSIMYWAQQNGMSTGIVTTTRVTHASPAGAYAHIANRDWENDAMILAEGYSPELCWDIAKQLIRGETGKNFNVILGGGRREFYPATWKDPIANKAGRRKENVSLVAEWQDNHASDRAEYIETREELMSVDPLNTDYLFGLFHYDHLNYALLNDDATNPSLTEMTAKAMQILHKNPAGSILFVEGGRIDHAHHDTKAQLSLRETLEFDDAINYAMKKTTEDGIENDTLILVTSDHAHVFSVAGYPERGNPLFEYDARTRATDGRPYPTLFYANGPGYKRPDAFGNRYDISFDEFNHPSYRQTTGAPINSETHGGDDVLIFSRGPFSHLLTGVVMQSYIPHALKYAACIGEDLTYCD